MRLAIPLLLVACMAGLPDASAEDRLFLMGGEVGAASYYSYAGVVLPGPGREAGRGLLQRYWVDAFGYEYDGGPGRVKARAYGGEAALGYGTSSALGWVSGFLGARFTDTDLTPDDNTAEARGQQLGLKAELQAERALATHWRGGVIASYSSQQQGYWLRGRLTRGAAGAQYVGPEVVMAGNSESRSKAIGLVYGTRLRESSWSAAVKAGYRDDSGDDGVYAGLELGYAF